MGGLLSAPDIPKFPDQRSSVSCKCGKAIIEFRNVASIIRFECCCFSCRQRQEWVNANSCPGVEAYAMPCDFTMLHNAITKVQGEEYLQRTVFRSVGNGTKWVSTKCCKSILAISSPLYNGNVINVPRATCNLSCHESMDPVIRIQTKEWSARKVGEGYTDEKNMPPFGRGKEYVLDGRSLVSMLWNLRSVGFFTATGTKPYREKGDRTLEGLMETMGELVVVDIPEYTHITTETLKKKNET